MAGYSRQARGTHGQAGRKPVTVTVDVADTLAPFGSGLPVRLMIVLPAQKEVVMILHVVAIPATRRQPAPS